MQFYFIRHGQSENNLLWETTGASVGRNQDPELTPTGVKQAQVLADFLAHGIDVFNARRPNQQGAGFDITHLYTSLMVRSVATGTKVARELNLPLTAWVDAHETGGIYLADEKAGTFVGQPGNNRKYFETNYPDLVLPVTLGEAGWWNRPFEEREVRPIRAEHFLQELVARHGGTDDHVALISHGGFYNHLMRALLKMTCENCWFGINNVAITRVDFSPEDVGVVYSNRIDFLPRDLIT